jgi:hypothetical protein
MLISDIDYLEPVSETSAMHLIGSSGFNALAIADFFALASSYSTVTNADVKNKAVSLPYGAFASSFIKLTSIAPGSNGVTSASATTSASISPSTIKPI